MHIEITAVAWRSPATSARSSPPRWRRVFRHLSDAGLSASVVVSRAKLEKLVEVTVHARGEHFLHAVGSGPTWQFASTMVAERLDQQASTG